MAPEDADTSLQRDAEPRAGPVVERFAPSPTGFLHLGHAFSALVAWRAARAAGGRFLLRLEDLDRSRVRSAFAEAILTDLDWLGIRPDAPVMLQSQRGAAHRAALATLSRAGLVFRCTCTRSDIRAAAAPQEGDGPGLDGPVYPGTCRRHPPPSDRPAALRLDLGRALALLGDGPLRFTELGAGPGGESGMQSVAPSLLRRMAGDVVVQRRDGTVAYHLAVVVDDAAQGVSHVTRGEDLFHATILHRLLQRLLGLPCPVWRHHRLIRDTTGRRLAKRDDDRSLRSLREAGWTPADVVAAVGLPALTPHAVPNGPSGA
ncbi:MAG: tRNA glutamyl-Q(34) synthetase GluQRS [Pseudomonadota bacterium]